MRTVAGPARKVWKGERRRADKLIVHEHARAWLVCDCTVIPPGSPAVAPGAAGGWAEGRSSWRRSAAARSTEASALRRRSRRALHESYTIRAPNHAPPAEFFPARAPFTNTSASAGVDRINKLPRAGSRPRAIAPDADRDGIGAGKRMDLGTGAGDGRRKIDGCLIETGLRIACRHRRPATSGKIPATTPPRFPKTTNIATIGHRRLRGSARSSIGASARRG